MKNNELFSNEQALQIFDAFESFLDPRTKQMNVHSLLSCASTLGLDEKYPTIMNILRSIEHDNPHVDYDTFLTELTERLGNVKTPEGRETLFNLIDSDNKGVISFDDLKRLAKEVGHIISDDDLNEIFQNITRNESITKEEFERYLSRKIDKNF